MARQYSNITAFLPTGSTFQIHRRQAAELVISGGADWVDRSYRQIRLNQKGAMKLRGLSCRVGEALAQAYTADREKNGWAAVMVSHIRNQRESPSVQALGQNQFHCER